jgi:hypothetical protein
MSEDLLHGAHVYAQFDQQRAGRVAAVVYPDVADEGRLKELRILQ